MAGIRMAVAAVMVVGLSAAAFAQADVIKQRQDKMNAIGGVFYGGLLKMFKGEQPYDQAKAKQAIETILASSEGVEDLFPAGSDTGAKNAASPKIFADPAGFKAALEKMRAVVKAQAANAEKDLDGVKIAAKEIGAACNACHDVYRLKK